MSDGYISIRNWRRFQHYSDRNPPWIKNYTDLTSKDEYRRLSASTRGVLHGLWIEYATSNGRLPSDTRDLSGRLGLRVTKRQLEALNHAGFIDIVASTGSANGASPEEKSEKDFGVSEGSSARPDFNFQTMLRNMPA